MKQSEIKIGGVYWTYIGQSLCQVEVVSRIEGRIWSSLPGARKDRDTFRVRRMGEVQYLPKTRTAASLRDSSAKLF